MHHEIERKFLIQSIPRIKEVEATPNEEHFLQHGDLVEERIQKRGTSYEYEIKTLFGNHEWRRDKRTWLI